MAHVHSLTFKELAIKMLEKKPQMADIRGMRVLAFDPGQTTGWAYFEGDELKASGQLITRDIQQANEQFCALFDREDINPQHVVFEHYRIYAHKTTTHSNSDVPTLRIIGCLETICTMRGFRYTSQPAGLAKNFCTDTYLKGWGWYKEGQRHARDAIRHGAYFLLFGKVNKIV